MRRTGHLAPVGSDTEEVTGSNPVAPTTALLSRAFVDPAVPLMTGSRWWTDTSGRRAFPSLTKAFSSAGCRTCGTQVRPATEGTHPHPRREKFLSTLQGRSLQAAGGRPRPVTPRPLAEDAPSALRHQREPLRQLAHPGFLHTTKPQLSLQHVVEDTGDGRGAGTRPGWSGRLQPTLGRRSASPAAHIRDGPRGHHRLVAARLRGGFTTVGACGRRSGRRPDAGKLAGCQRGARSGSSGAG